MTVPTKALRATATPHSRGFFNAVNPCAAPVNTMSLEEIRAAESLGMDGVVGVASSPQDGVALSFEQSRRQFPLLDKEDPADVWAVRNGVAKYAGPIYAYTCGCD
ncbi:MAG: hypothetical protein PHD48_01000 [Alphaproteobacteria bacterium]|nr:hypothetical protein [Alphaproteobacteria bacterium]